MTSGDLVYSVEHTDQLKLGSLSERLVYLYLRYHADRKSVVRLSMSELASTLEVNRQTILKHVNTLMEKRLLTREGHGRYRVHSEPWSLRNYVQPMLAALNDGDVLDTSELARRAYGEALDWSSEDPRIEEVFQYTQRMERAGVVWHDELTGDLRKGKRKSA